MKKWVLVVVIMLVALGLVVQMMRSHSSPHTPAWARLPDGSLVRIRAVTYGTNHVVGSDLAKKTAHLPLLLQNVIKSVFGPGAVPLQTLPTATPELIVWLEYSTNNPVPTTVPIGDYLEAFLGDTNNFISGEAAHLSNPQFRAPLEPLHFHVFPRRQREITLDLFYHDARGRITLCNRFSFTNPEFRKYPVWQAESLPETKHAGAVEVSLLGLETGHDNNTTVSARDDGKTEYTYGTNRTDGNNYTLVNLNLKPLANSNEVWQVAGVEIADATGNTADSQSMSWSGGISDFEFRPGLWPDEPAWKLKFAVKRSQGFRPEELVVFKNVPLGEINHTNVLAWVTNFDGVGLTLESICRRPPFPKGTWDSRYTSDVKFTITSLPAGMQLDLLDVVCNSGETNHSVSWESSNNYRTYHFSEMPTNAQTADFVFAFHKLEFFEFTAKPELPKPKLGGKQ